MESKRKHRKVLRAAFTKCANELEQFVVEKNRQQVCVVWELLQQKYDDLRVVDIEIYDVLLQEDATSEAELALEMEGKDSYLRRFTDLKIRVEDFKVEVESRSVAGTRCGLSGARAISAIESSTAEVAGKRKFKLPVLEFKKFGGEVKDWLAFWAQFKKVHEDSDIDAHDKISYLIQATVPNSRARQLVESFPAMQENYGKIIDSLKSRFGKEDLQIEVYVRGLLKLIIDNSMTKGRMDLPCLYDKIETQLRALETLNITKEKYAAMLFPLIESCLPEHLIRTWQRSSEFSMSRKHSNGNLLEPTSLEYRLEGLMTFLRNEVENEQRIVLATEGFGLGKGSTSVVTDLGRKRGVKGNTMPSTAADLVNCSDRKCIFCDGNHRADSCFKAQTFPLNRKKEILSEKKGCFQCLKTGHRSRWCRERLQCLICKKPHTVIMCPELPAHKRGSEENSTTAESMPSENLLANNINGYVFLETLRVRIEGDCGSVEVRALIDTGSQRSYVLKSTVQRLGLTPKRREKIVHCLFGGRLEERKHGCFDLKLTSENYHTTIEALDQQLICNKIAPVFHGPWTEELKENNILLSDCGDTGPIELLIGSDVCGKLYTGKRLILQCGLVAVETLLGWTISGRVQPIEKNISSATMTIFSLLAKDVSVRNLWELDVLGISDPKEKKSREEMDSAAKEFFTRTIQVDDDGRYEVKLPWIEGHPPLPHNYLVAKKRLDTTVKKLRNNAQLESYNLVFKEWLSEGIIEEIPEVQGEHYGHYLPHRPVIKENSLTTKIRPVFDASAHEKDKPSLNHCLEKGVNLIEAIPTILLRFRLHKIGVISDIRKAFLQISLQEADRKFLQFLWIDEGGKEKVFRHRRVVFGISSSPFLLGATIDHHLSVCRERCKHPNSPYCKETVERLSKSFYVDNCVTSLPDEDSSRQFIREASILMGEGKFDLRGWEHTKQGVCKVNVLGLVWNTDTDTLCLNGDWLKEHLNVEKDKLTKRVILSVAQHIFDPIGFTCPVSLSPKLLLQKTWEDQLGWDTPVSEEIEQTFLEWLADLPLLLNITIPRWISINNNKEEQCSLHTFTDASQKAYAAAVFIRVECRENVYVHLMAAKARVAPKKMTIPRLELMAATIGARLYASMRETLEIENVESFFWSDSSTVLSWIRRKEEWATFVWNRIEEIRKLTPMEAWRHIPGTLNPADLPSRGCSAKQLLESKWWEGPTFLYEPSQFWPNENFLSNEDEVSKEIKKRLVTCVLDSASDEWHLMYFSKYSKMIRMVAWILRFVSNLKNAQEKEMGQLSVEEINHAENFIFKMVQQEFSDSNSKMTFTFDTFRDEFGVIRVKSRVFNRNDSDNFRSPMLLPGKHPVVCRMILQLHEQSCHLGTQGMMGLLRERFWILGGRRAVRSVIYKCVVCKRHNSKPCQVTSPPLPKDRVRDAAPFEIAGVDFAGPLYLKTDKKVWICLFTCAVYRAVHLELCLSLSTECFMQAFRRFVARRGRPKTIYSDNGTNFVGMENAFCRLNWDEIVESSSIQRITWRFNPPTAPWWGGFWERLVGVLKQMLRKVLGRASLNYEELLTIICDCESFINSRPLIDLSGDPRDLNPLTPMMFLRDQSETGVFDCDAIDRATLCRRVQYRQTLRENLRRRFRSEYLGQLQLKSHAKLSRSIHVGEVVLIGCEQKKRLDWPLGRVRELLPGKDGVVRLVRVDTSNGSLLRPVQRVYPLECNDEEDLHPKSIKTSKDETSPEGTSCGEETPGESVCSESAGVNDICKDIKSRAPEDVKVTRCGRLVNIPKRYR